MSAIPHMSADEIRALKARMDLVSTWMEAEEAATPVDSVRNREIAEALAVSAWERGWRPQHDAERAAEKMHTLKLLHGSFIQSAD